MCRAIPAPRTITDDSLYILRYTIGIMNALTPKIIEDTIKAALREDLNDEQDITSALTIPEDLQTTVVLRAREDGILAGLNVALKTFELVDKTIKTSAHKTDGDRLYAGDNIATIKGNARATLTAERTALNFLTHMCGIATATSKYVEATTGTNAKIRDTRKTLPNLRAFQKYAVTCGGGHNHRFGLYDAVLIKDNHIAAAGGITQTLSCITAETEKTKPIEIEVDTLEQLQEVLAFNANHERGVDIVLLDNMPTETLKKAVQIINGSILTEASGGVHLDSVREIAKTGVDYISVGALTHSVKNFDIGLDTP